jgi:integrase/recombinase XerD
MLTQAVDAYVTLRRACGFKLRGEEYLLRSFAAFSEAKDQHQVRVATAIEWAGLTSSAIHRARRLAAVIRFTRHIRAEHPDHELPPQYYGSPRSKRPAPYVLCLDDVRRLVEVVSQFNGHPLRGDTYSTLFSLLACTGLRKSEAIALRYMDITADGLVIRKTKFRSSRLVPVHETARTALHQYIERRRPYAPLDDHVFISSTGKPLGLTDVERAFRAAAATIGLPIGRGQRRPTPHSLRHFFTVRALQACPDGRDRVAQHTVALSTYLGHRSVESTYWYLEATAELMTDIAERGEAFFERGQP